MSHFKEAISWGVWKSLPHWSRLLGVENRKRSSPRLEGQAAQHGSPKVGTSPCSGFVTFSFLFFFVLSIYFFKKSNHSETSTKIPHTPRANKMISLIQVVKVHIVSTAPTLPSWNNIWQNYHQRKISNS